MASERKKKPWQFSLARAMAAMTLICATLAMSSALFSADMAILGELVVLMGIGSVIGVLVGGGNGAALGEIAGLTFYAGLWFWWSLADAIIF